jgi:dTDP-4-amino-4,6-dideoxygalactose transaminase
MPDPAASGRSLALERELAAAADVRHAIAVSSGTAALHTALVAAGVGPGDEVLVPGVSVVMSVAPILYAGARPVFVDCTDDGDIDLRDLTAKCGPRARAVLPVYLWGRAGDPAAVTEFARQRGLRVIEDACQAQATLIGGQPLGTFGDLGCFSLKDGKILWSGEGGYILTSNDELAATCRAYRSHWTTPPPGQPPLARLGHNYRLAEPLAVIARANLARFGDLARQRHHQATRMLAQVAGTPGLTEVLSGPGEAWNHYSPLWRISLPAPRGFCRRLADRGVPNSIGSFGLVSCDQRSMFAENGPARCPTAAYLVDTTLAVLLTAHDDDARISRLAQIITQEARLWTGDHA